MHSDPAAFELTKARSLAHALQLLAEEPGRHAPMAGGTELMVAFNAGRLTARSLISIQHLPELRFIRGDGETVHIGAGSTFADIRRSATLREAFPLLEKAASWTGSVANQNRATIGGNICNASPAADTPPVLLAYDAEVTLASARGTRTLPYREFHLGYKRTALAADELLLSVTLQRPRSPLRHYIRKVGTRRAQAISKTALAAVARVEHGRVVSVCIGAASLADRPVRLLGAERALQDASVAPGDLEATIRAVRAALGAEIRPIDDIRSTERYRRAVAANLLEEFVRTLANEDEPER